MELWIRSQSKLSLIKINNICIRDDNIIVNYNDNFNLEDYAILGTYKTKERALEVLDEIQNQIFHHCCIDDSKASIYIMPQE